VKRRAFFATVAAAVGVALLPKVKEPDWLTTGYDWFCKKALPQLAIKQPIFCKKVEISPYGVTFCWRGETVHGSIKVRRHPFWNHIADFPADWPLEVTTLELEDHGVIEVKAVRRKNV
jgi:hypothetical protein